jgi:hypothetical protein
VSAELLVGRRGNRSCLRPGNVSFIFNSDTVMPMPSSYVLSKSGQRRGLARAQVENALMRFGACDASV